MKSEADSITDAQMPEAWANHRRGCKSCQKYIEGKSATLVHVCLRGAPMVKRLLEISARPALAAKRRAEREVYMASEEGKYKATPTQLRQVMRYKGDE